MLVLLLGVIIVEFFFKDLAYHYHTLILIADYIVIATFVADLAFKYMRTRDIPTWARKYWLDILAVFPFFLLERFFEDVADATST